MRPTFFFFEKQKTKKTILMCATVAKNMGSGNFFCSTDYPIYKALCGITINSTNYIMYTRYEIVYI